MFVDASAIVAILGREPGHEKIEKRLARTDGLLYVSPLVRFAAAAALARMKSGSTRPMPDQLRQAVRADNASFPIWTWGKWQSRLRLVASPSKRVRSTGTSSHANLDTTADIWAPGFRFIGSQICPAIDNIG
jgi:hypothetical protein